MVVLHIAHLDSNPFGGVNTAVPQHIKAQQEIAQVGFINVTNIMIEGIQNQFPYHAKFCFQELPAPFNKPDIIIFHEIYRPPFLKLSRLAVASGIPYVVFPHGGLTKVAQNTKALKKRIGNLLLFNRYINGAVAIQCLSQRELEQTTFGRKKFIGTNGVAVNVQKTKFSNTDFKLVYIGRLDIHIKGLDLLTEALSKCRDILLQKHCQVHIYGPDENGSFQQLENLVQKLALEQILVLHQAISGKPKMDALCEADCFIQTSRTEGMSMGVLEAQAIGLPCILTEGVGMTEMIQMYDSGWICANSAEGIAEAIMQALEQRDLLPQKSQNAIKLIDENFSWDHIAEETLRTYEMMAGI